MHDKKQDQDTALEQVEGPVEKVDLSSTPAYQRFHNLAQPTQATLPLPYSYKQLGETIITHNS